MEGRTLKKLPGGLRWHWGAGGSGLCPEDARPLSPLLQGALAPNFSPGYLQGGRKMSLRG